MDKIMSTRMDEAIIQQIGILAKKLGTSKKAVLEKAVLNYSQKIETELSFDVLTHTLGAWQREESSAQTVQTIKKRMKQSQERYQG